jgi:hypothetical protein
MQRDLLGFSLETASKLWLISRKNGKELYKKKRKEG